MSDDEFYQLACELLQVCALNQQEFFDAFNSIISGFNHKVKEVLKKLKDSNSFKLIALSNVNSSHWDYLLNQKWGFIEYFDELILSHEVHMTKPEKKIFDYAIEKAGCKPEEILFIDDGLNNVVSAKKLGIVGIHFSTAKDLIEELRQLGIRIN